MSAACTQTGGVNAANTQTGGVTTARPTTLVGKAALTARCQSQPTMSTPRAPASTVNRTPDQSSASA